MAVARALVTVVAAEPVGYGPIQRHSQLLRITQLLLAQVVRRGLQHLDHKAILVVLRYLIQLVRLVGAVAVVPRPR